MTIVENGIPLHDIVNGMLQAIENQVETQEIGGFLRNVLTVHTGTVGTNLASQVHQRVPEPAEGS